MLKKTVESSIFGEVEVSHEDPKVFFQLLAGLEEMEKEAAYLRQKGVTDFMLVYENPSEGEGERYKIADANAPRDRNKTLGLTERSAFPFFHRRDEYRSGSGYWEREGAAPPKQATDREEGGADQEANYAQIVQKKVDSEGWTDEALAQYERDRDVDLSDLDEQTYQMVMGDLAKKKVKAYYGVS